MYDTPESILIDAEEAQEEGFCEMLDEMYPVVKMGELTFYPSQILKSCDPVAYRIELTDYLDDLNDKMND
jgi:hypothetical protein